MAGTHASYIGSSECHDYSRARSPVRRSPLSRRAAGDCDRRARQPRWRRADRSRAGELPAATDRRPRSAAASRTREIQAILLTHIHLDHAGATGTLVREHPHIRVFVHERGAPHMIDPSKLMASAARIYGDDNMDSLWGPMVPVPAANITTLAGGEKIDAAGAAARRRLHAGPRLASRQLLRSAEPLRVRRRRRRHPPAARRRSSCRRHRRRTSTSRPGWRASIA